MEIIISKSLDTPIYEQIERQLETKIRSGELKAHDKLPGMRTLAKDLKVSVITTKRAYDDLERKGYIYTLPGKGSFINSVEVETVPVTNKIDDYIINDVSNLIKRAKKNELGLKELLTFIYKEWNNERN